MSLVSVIIPVYNTSRWLPRCLGSVREQRLRDLEIVCVDDGSTDVSAEWVAEQVRQDGRIRLISQPNQGLSVARNTGLRATAAPFVYCLDSDDFIHAQLLELAVAALGDRRADFALVDYLKVPPEAHPAEADVVYAEGGAVPTQWMPHPLRAFLRRNESPDIWRFVYRRAALGTLQFVPGLRYEDLDFTYRFLRRVSCGVWLHAPLHFYAQTPNSLLRHPVTCSDLRTYAWIVRHLHQDARGDRTAARLFVRKLFPRILKNMWKRVRNASKDNPELAELAPLSDSLTAGLLRDRVLSLFAFSPKWQWHLLLLLLRGKEAHA